MSLLLLFAAEDSGVVSPITYELNVALEDFTLTSRLSTGFWHTVATTSETWTNVTVAGEE